MNYEYGDLLVHYCDLNSIPYHESWKQVVEHMIAYPTSKVQYITPYWRLFQTLQQLMNNSIDLTAFMNYADILSPAVLWWESHSPFISDCLVVDSHYIFSDIDSGWKKIIYIK